jgi:multiple sugar transport system permease protein
MLQKKLLLSIAIILIVIWSIGPLYWMVNLSFQSRLDIVTIPAHLYPPNPTFQNYRVIIEHLVPVIDQEVIDTNTVTGQIYRVDVIALFNEGIVNSMIVAGVTTILTIAISLPAAYAFSRFNFPFRKTLLIVILFTRAIPPIVLVIPYYQLFDQINLLGTYLGIILTYLVLTVPIITWIMAGFFATLPLDIEKAARMDGCSRKQMFSKIIVPLAMPGIMVSVILAFLICWNEYLFALMLGQAGKGYLYLAPPVIAGFRGGLGSAMSVVYIIPPILATMFLQKYITNLKIVDPGMAYGGDQSRV